MDGFFGNLFDLNGDGKMDLFESGLEFMLMEELMEEDEDEEYDEDDW